MKHEALTFFLFRTCFPLAAILGFCCPICPTYFASNFAEIICVMENNKAISNYESTLTKLGGCEFEDRLDGMSQLKYVDCPFEYKRRNQFPGRTITSFYSGRKNRNTVLQSNVFSFMCEVETISLRNANIKIIESGAFDCLVRLQRLDLTLNRIKILPQGVLWTMVNLVDLRIEYNSLESMGHLPFANLTRLNILFLRDNKLKNIDNAFYSNHRLQFFHVSFNEIDSISENAFTEAQNLKEVEIMENLLKTIHPDTFGPLADLETLILASNKLTSLLGSPFRNNSNLLQLILSSNNFTEIQDGIFLGLSSLRQLDLRRNNIAKLSANSFKSLTSIKEIYLGSNELTSLYSSDSQSGIFFDMDLDVLTLEGNKIKNLSNAFRNSTIKWLHISDNSGLVLANNSFHGLRSLTKMSMRSCNLTSVPKEIFKNTPELQALSLATNDIHEIDPLTFSFINLTILDLTDNKLEKFDISSLKQITNLFLAQNKLFKIDNSKKLMLYHIIQLDISSNFLTEYWLKAPFLRILNISHNQISSLKGIIGTNPNLVQLDISHNNVSQVTDSQWKRIMYWEKFNAINNSIEEIIIPEPSDYLHWVKRSRSLHLENNRVKTIRLPNYTDRQSTLGSEVRRINATLNIYLSDNPLQCGCSAYELFTYLHGFDLTRHYIRFADTLRCHEPSQLKGKMVKDLKAIEFLCDYPSDCYNESQCLPASDCEDRCSCYFRPHDNVRIVNCSDKGYDNLPRNVPENTQILYMNHNNMTSLSELDQPVWENLREIHLENNAIDSAEFSIPQNVTFMGLKDNFLSNFPFSLQRHADNNSEFKVTLSKNEWSCNCSAIPLKSFFLRHSYKLIDFDEVTCSLPNRSTVLLQKMSDLELCPPSPVDVDNPIYVNLGVAAGSIIVVSACLIIYYHYRLFILAFLYTRCNWFYKLFCCSRDPDENKTYDGFLAYGGKDFEAAEAIVQELEEHPPHFQLCVHDRDWLAGEHIITNIITSVEISRKTLIIVSGTFLQSVWFPLEFEAAFYQALRDRRDRMIVIVKGDLPPLSELPDNVRYFLSTRTYLRWGEPWFFDRLRFAMHHDGPFVMTQLPQQHRAAAAGALENPIELENFQPLEH